MKVDVVNLHRHFGKTRAVDGISFCFSSGQVFGFIGPNGAGKTTTMRVLATLDEPTDGDAFVDGASVKEEPEHVRRLVGFVPDSLPAHPDITVHEYLDFFARAYGLRGPGRREAVGEVEEFTGVAGMRDKLLSSLSKGMKQRVSLGRALVQDPSVLILDEPAAGLDPRARVELRELLALLGKRDKAILVSSHILTELTEICNGLVVIEEGKILETGTIEEVMERCARSRTVAVRSAGGPEPAYKALLEIPHVREVRIVDSEVHVDLDGRDDAAADVLAELVGRGLRVTEFRQLEADLEDIFMTITEGKVQ